MNQTLATVIGLLAFALVLATPITILWLVGRARQRSFDAIAGWARTKGLQPSDASASALVHPGVPTLNYARGRDLISFASHVGGSKRGSFTIYLRPDQARLPALALQRNMWGGGGEALGDPALDAHYRLLHGGPAALAVLCRPDIKEALNRDHDDITHVHIHEGVVVLSYGARQAIDPVLWDQAWALAEQLLAGG